MQLRSFELATDLFIKPVEVFDTWLDSTRHSLLTQAPALIDPRVGGQYSLWGGSVTGEFVHIDRPRVIAQTWRTVDFSADMPDTRLELTFEERVNGCRLRVVHAHIPASMASAFRSAWTQYYFPRMTTIGVLPQG
ncbi:MAG: SRPBCC domain-containing protein [Alphaproteobacteria bacterium]|nr:SRPBCC domain-containing protein [Alphaproteobacteria bacterium]